MDLENDVVMNEREWKLDITVKDEEMETECSLYAEFLEVIESPDFKHIPIKSFLQFKLQEGDQMLYNSFMRDMMLEEGGVNIWNEDEETD